MVGRSRDRAWQGSGEGGIRQPETAKQIPSERSFSTFPALAETDKRRNGVHVTEKRFASQQDLKRGREGDSSAGTASQPSWSCFQYGRRSNHQHEGYKIRGQHQIGPVERSFQLLEFCWR